MSEVKVNKISPRSGTDVTLGDSGDTFTLPTGTTLDVNTLTVNTLTAAALTANADITATGITFDSGSNVLEKYETGTWTPEYGGSTTDPDSITYDAVTSGVYTRIGNMVYAGFFLRTDAMTIGAGAGGPIVKNFPFSIAEGRWALDIAYKSAWVTYGPSYGLASSADYVRLYRESASTSASGLSMSNFGTGADDNVLYGAVTYRTNDA